MSDAFQCDRCGEFQQGCGTHARFGRAVPNSLGGYDPTYKIEEELCDDCWEGLIDLVEAYFEDIRIDERD